MEFLERLRVVEKADKQKEILIILLGPPGVGKGTQATLLTQQYNIPALSSGNVLHHFIDQTSDANQEDAAIKDVLQRKISNGEFIDDEIVQDIIRKRISLPDCDSGFILDGFPRNIKQAQILPTILQQAHRSPAKTIVVSIDLDTDTIVKRISGRVVCAKCRTSYNKFYLPPKQEGICDNCGSTQFISRSDDNSEVIKNRITTYEKETKPLLQYYETNTDIIQISGNGSHLEIFSAISQKMNKILNA